MTKQERKKIYRKERKENKKKIKEAIRELNQSKKLLANQNQSIEKKVEIKKEIPSLLKYRKIGTSLKRPS